MEYILKDKCECWGDIVIVSYDKKARDTTIKLVSHGVCTYCLKNISLLSELYSTFIRDYCYAKKCKLK